MSLLPFTWRAWSYMPSLAASIRYVAFHQVSGEQPLFSREAAGVEGYLEVGVGKADISWECTCTTCMTKSRS